MEIQITRANTKYDNAVREVNRLKSLNTELVREIDRKDKSIKALLKAIDSAYRKYEMQVKS